MREEVKSNILNFLMNNQIFTSEIQLQIKLGLFFESLDKYEIYYEYRVPKALLHEYPWDNISENDISVDIVLKHDNKYLPIEIKYKTKRLELEQSIFNSETHMYLPDHLAKNDNCYLFWKDVKRMELLKAAFAGVEKGIVIFLTNDPSYLNSPREGSAYSNYSVHRNREISAGTKLEWAGKTALNKPEFFIQNKYKISWQELNHYFLLLL